jgi:hypothetical protein
MRNRLAGSILAVVAALACSSVVHTQTAEKPGATKAQKAAPTTDLTGVWRRSRRAPNNARRYTIYELIFTLTSERIPMTPWAEAKFKAAKPNVGPNAVTLAESNDPLTNCFPPGVPRIYLIRGEPVEIMQAPGRVVLLYEYDHFVREIYTDGRQHPKDLNPTWMGDSIGKWEGDTFVVDSIGFNDKTWLDNDGHPHSEALHVVERIRRATHDTLTIDTTIDDPKAYTKSWGGHMMFELKPDWNLGEMVCEDNITFSDMQKTTEGGK